MNKLEIVDKEKDIDLLNDNYLLEVDGEEKFVGFNVKGNNKLVVVGNNCYLHLYFIFDINNENSIIVNCIGKNVTLAVKASLFKNSKFIFNYGVLSNIDSTNDYEISHIGDNSIPLSAIDSRGNIATSSLSIPIVSIRNNSSYHDNDDYDDLEGRISDLESRMDDLDD